VSRTQLLVVALAALLATTLGWIARSGLWRRHRIAIVAGAAIVGLLALTRRIGLQELAVVAAVTLLAFVLLPARR
jgi:threonine dehydrogenase-like Zn-dependent dehydrogenase